MTRLMLATALALTAGPLMADTKGGTTDRIIAMGDGETIFVDKTPPEARDPRPVETPPEKIINMGEGEEI
ncbi:hypothetical protein JQU17_00025 [Ponticoccus sp. SC2-23]|uniref:hypothetical protein n=1 Tax=Alexandriicola marinus TaxID=2081710 RepID=UPI000FD85BB0|nr:hypothetical protein [Alexandriicola marinus]MBM1218564.1 hypothetical protein [Ponticoccus sp. SC6-9]MBM1224364.1 hypothetical protein [Ponticoccus sp. SC6-15]MBM1229856.1 hypothetical protein [Ponticoccus sp. SC6-38]MBM1233330.1 hypothetical protein [Ponticoccus sp. SC6-45]MBM1236720.1 hypothetical protein [Ponticoccus sp. SC6-49]MBM1242341.1 hypothetical protein [Ponticoccus sp. SC2-64]MBM1246854.1 hypothetical protein [Ponticoccus sp. SC6-42]MBM1251332.1 hypothetical protein [Pontico